MTSFGLLEFQTLACHQALENLIVSIHLRSFNQLLVKVL